MMNKETSHIHHIYIVKYEEEAYPPLLRMIKDPPKQLYCVGKKALLTAGSFAVVGGRKPTEYGKWIAHKIGQRLAENGITTVSGMAAGIDTFAHKGAVAAGGNTIAVLGCGIDICFPATNKNLFAEIKARGLVVSEYPPGHPPARYTFPRRNRIISGLCPGVIIVEAGANSGSLITAELAAEQGRNVYAVPGNITSPMSLGTNRLICDGAVPIANVDDLIEDICGKSYVPDKIFFNNLGQEEKAIVEVLAKGGEMSIDELSRRLSKPVGNVRGIVTVLELKGMLKNSMGKVFIAKSL